jgi:uncharacterized protein (TIGR03000 family)
MYSIVLMMAVSTGADLTGCHRGHGCGGYGGCYGGYSGCYDYGGGCYGYGYGGYGYGGCGYGGDYSNQYPRGANETQEQYDYCISKSREMPPQEYAGFRSRWLQMSPAERDKQMQQDKKKSSMLPRPAEIFVSLPADAKLTIDDQTTTSVGASRRFVSPPLAPNGSYTYTLKAEFVRDGKTVAVAKQVAVTPGKKTQVSFAEPAGTSVASR